MEHFFFEAGKYLLLAILRICWLFAEWLCESLVVAFFPSRKRYAKVTKPTELPDAAKLRRRRTGRTFNIAD